MGGTSTTAIDMRVQRAVRLEYFTVAWNVIEAVIAITAGILAASIALTGFGLDSIIETASGVALLWRFKQQRLGAKQAESLAVRMDVTRSK